MLLYDGKSLKQFWALQDYGIEEGDCIYLIISPSHFTQFLTKAREMLKPHPKKTLPNRRYERLEEPN